MLRISGPQMVWLWVCLEAPELRTSASFRTHCIHPISAPRPCLGPPHGSWWWCWGWGTVLLLSQCCLLCTKAVWALLLMLSSINSAIYGAVVPGWRQGFIFVVSMVCVLKGSYSNQHRIAESMEHSTYPFSKNKRREYLDNQDKYPCIQDASRKDCQE